jgi:hypothetical protein
MLHLFYSSDGDRFRGPWQDDGISPPRGNPAQAARVQDMMKAIKKKDGEPEHNYSWAMSHEDMQQVYNFILKKCLANEKAHCDPQSLAKRGRFLYYLAMSSLAWTIWTQCVLTLVELSCSLTHELLLLCSLVLETVRPDSSNSNTSTSIPLPKYARMENSILTG